MRIYTKRHSSIVFYTVPLYIGTLNSSRLFVSSFFFVNSSFYTYVVFLSGLAEKFSQTLCSNKVCGVSICMSHLSCRILFICNNGQVNSLTVEPSSLLYCLHHHHHHHHHLHPVVSMLSLIRTPHNSTYGLPEAL